MNNLISKLSMFLGLVYTACVVPIPLESEDVEQKTPPRFIRNQCTPAYLTEAVIDSSSNSIDLIIVVEDPDVDDEIPYRVYRDYGLAQDKEDSKSDTLLKSGAIPPVVDSETGQNRQIRVYNEYNLSDQYVCSSSRGDVTGSKHLIEIVITDQFSNDSSVYPYWRATVGQSDVWSFFVICVQGSNKKKNGEEKNENYDAMSAKLQIEDEQDDSSAGQKLNEEVLGYESPGKFADENINESAHKLQEQPIEENNFSTDDFAEISGERSDSSSSKEVISEKEIFDESTSEREVPNEY
ncbi:MAG: hypothetical protein PF689_11230 [Deltaproteobacteria bacterium]|jgi:hypothetical protein|nr:hypothetical protein [Deltaproteobacteria bacterium]